MLLKPEGVITLEFPHLRAADRGEPVRHDLPRALLVLLARSRSSGSLRAPRSQLVRRRGTADPRRVAAGLSCACRRRRASRARAWQRCARASRRAGFADLDDLRAFGARCEDQAQAAGVPDRGQGRGQAHRRLRRPGQGQHAAELLRHPHRLPRLHGRPQSLQARPLHPGHAHPDPPGRSDRRGEARLCADPALEPEGRDHPQMRHVGDWGWQFVVPIPEVRRHRSQRS